jgi:hypothetical protein
MTEAERQRFLAELRITHVLIPTGSGDFDLRPVDSRLAQLSQFGTSEAENSFIFSNGRP